METEEAATKAGKIKNEQVPDKLEDGLSSPIITSPRETVEGPTPQPEENPSSSPSQDPSEMTSPPVQTMGPASPLGYDPNRIPTSIFCTKPTNPAEWSVASNESLFSIHMGNNSFSRDYAILFGKSGDLQDWHGSELPRLDNPQTTKPPDPSGLPSVMESPPREETNRNSYGSDVSPKVEPGVKLEKHEKVIETKVTFTTTTTTTSSSSSPSTPPLEKQEKAEKPVHHAEVVKSNSPVAKKATPQTFPSPPRFSNESGHSGSSFAFPVLMGEGGKPDSMKVVPEHSEAQTQDSKETPNASSGRRWFSYLLFWPKCC